MYNLLSNPKTIPLILAVILFICKTFLPIMACIANKNKSGQGIKIIEEGIKFPIDLLFLSIGYILNNIISIIEQTTTYNDILLPDIIYIFLLSILMPFLTFYAEIAFNIFFEKKYFKASILILLEYISVVLILFFS